MWCLTIIRIILVKPSFFPLGNAVPPPPSHWIGVRSLEPILYIYLQVLRALRPGSGGGEVTEASRIFQLTVLRYLQHMQNGGGGRGWIGTRKRMNP
jgi:hypothetical protein